MLMAIPQSATNMLPDYDYMGSTRFRYDSILISGSLSLQPRSLMGFGVWRSEGFKVRGFKGLGFSMKNPSS